MCFTISRADTKKFKDSLDDGDIIYGWKWLYKMGRYYESVVYSMTWRMGKRSHAKIGRTAYYVDGVEGAKAAPADTTINYNSIGAA